MFGLNNNQHNLESTANTAVATTTAQGTIFISPHSFLINYKIVTVLVLIHLWLYRALYFISGKYLKLEGKWKVSSASQERHSSLIEGKRFWSS